MSSNPGSNDTGRPAVAGRGTNQGRFGGRGQDRSRVAPQVKRFTGKEESLGDEYIYEHTDGREASDQYSVTTDELIRYSSTKYKNGADVGRSLFGGARITIVLPPAPVATGNPPAVPEGETTVWKMQVSIVLSRRALLDANLQSAYALIKGQCSKPIIEKVQAQEGYEAIEIEQNPIGLLGLIRSVMFNYNSRKYRAVALVDIMKPDIVSQTWRSFARNWTSCGQPEERFACTPAW